MSKVLIIGNGFDLSLGLKTSYQDFIHSEEFSTLIGQEEVWVKVNEIQSERRFKRRNSLADHLQLINNLYNWIDIENELKKYPQNRKFRFESVQIQSDSIQCDFVELKNVLAKYVTRASQSGVLDGNSNAIKIIYQGGLGSRFQNLQPKKIVNFNSVFSFNYTNDVPLINDYLSKNKESWKNKNILHDFYQIHGNLSNLISGVEDGAVGNEKAFFLKSDHAEYGRVNVAKPIISADEVHFFGVSFGETDDSHFKPVFSQLIDPLNMNSSLKRKIYFYVHGFSGYTHLRNRLLLLTNSKLSDLKNFNDVNFFDTVENREIDQNWLNEKYRAIMLT